MQWVNMIVPAAHEAVLNIQDQRMLIKTFNIKYSRDFRETMTRQKFLMMKILLSKHYIKGRTVHKKSKYRTSLMYLSPELLNGQSLIVPNQVQRTVVRKVRIQQQKIQNHGNCAIKIIRQKATRSILNHIQPV
jgi:hypothetical protein